MSLDEHGQQIGAMKGKGTQFDAFKARFSNLYVTVKCTLEEFYYGCQKEINFQRIELYGDGKTQRMEVGTKLLTIKPGMGPQTTLTFPREGHQRPGQHPSDLIVSFQQLPHDRF